MKIEEIHNSLDKVLTKTQTPKKMSFSSSINIQISILKQFLNCKAYKSQQIKLSGSPTKVHFTAKSGKKCSKMEIWRLVELQNNIFFGFGFWVFKKKIVVSSQWKSACLSYEVSFISGLGMVSSESWKILHPNYYAHDCNS